MQDSHSCDPGSIPGRRKLLHNHDILYYVISFFSQVHNSARVA